MIRNKIPQRCFEKEICGKSGMKQGVAKKHWLGISEHPEQGLLDLFYCPKETLGGLSDADVLRSGLCPLLTRVTSEYSWLSAAGELVRETEKHERCVGLLIITAGDRFQIYYVCRGFNYGGPAFLSLPGSGMKSFQMFSIKQAGTEGFSKSLEARREGKGARNSKTEEERFVNKFSRSAGAIGKGNLELGYEILSCARRLRVGIIGLGRAGSWLAFRLAQMGVGSEGGIVLMDSDILNESNLPDMLVPEGAVGMPKVEAVAGTIRAFMPGYPVFPVFSNLSSAEAVDEIKRCDVVFTAVDEDSVRLGVSLIAARCHIPHIDICGACSRTGENMTETGGEVRLFLPGSLKGCLACYGKYDVRESVALLGLTVEEERERRSKLDWEREKGGSSADILFPVIGEVLQAFWAILRGEIKDSFWWHYTKGSNGKPDWEVWTNNRRPGRCAVCRGQAGLGDLILQMR